jgi:GNAT superfamily N-acetyltransferase
MLHPRRMTSVSETLISAVQPDDWAALREVRLAALAEAPYAFGSTLAREEALGEPDWRGRIARSAYFMARRDGQAAGIAAGVGARAALAASWDEAEPGTAHLLSMWVGPLFRGLGVADALVQAVSRWAHDDGAERVQLWVTDVNLRARAFYRRMGFASTGRRQLVRPHEPDHWEEELVRPLR